MGVVAIALLSALIYGHFGLLQGIFFWSIPGVFGVLLYRYPEFRNETYYLDHAAITMAELMIGILGGWILFSIGYWHRASFHDRDLIRKARGGQSRATNVRGGRTMLHFLELIALVFFWIALSWYSVGLIGVALMAVSDRAWPGLELVLLAPLFGPIVLAGGVISIWGDFQDFRLTILPHEMARAE